MLNELKKYGFLFDLDGTLINNMQYHHLAWQSLLHSMGYFWDLDEVKEKVWGKNQEMFERLFPNQYSATQVEELSNQKESKYIELYRSKISLIKGAQQFIDQAVEQQIKLAIATAAPTICVDFVKASLKLETYFESIIDSEMVVKGKPDPECYLKAAESIGVSIENCLVFEDAPVGVAAAMAANMPAIVILTSHKEEEFKKYPNVVRFINDYTEIPLKDCLNWLPS